MAYNRKNRLQRIADIHDIYWEHESKMTKRAIWKNYIFPLYRISERCFYNYLTIPAKRELKRIAEKEAMQTSLF
jgi:hypothetical protein